MVILSRPLSTRPSKSDSNRIRSRPLGFASGLRARRSIRRPNSELGAVPTFPTTATAQIRMECPFRNSLRRVVRTRSASIGATRSFSASSVGGPVKATSHATSPDHATRQTIRSSRRLAAVCAQRVRTQKKALQRYLEGHKVLLSAASMVARPPNSRRINSALLSASGALALRYGRRS